MPECVLSAAAAGAPAAAQMEYGAIKPEQCEAVRARKDKTRREEITRFQAAMAANKTELAQLVQQHGLQHADPSGARCSHAPAPCCPPCLLVCFLGARVRQVGLVLG